MFFLIGNIRIIIDEKMKKKLTMCSWEWTQQSTKQNAKENNQETKWGVLLICFFLAYNRIMVKWLNLLFPNSLSFWNNW